MTLILKFNRFKFGINLERKDECGFVQPNLGARKISGLQREDCISQNKMGLCQYTAPYCPTLPTTTTGAKLKCQGLSETL